MEVRQTSHGQLGQNLGSKHHHPELKFARTLYKLVLNITLSYLSSLILLLMILMDLGSCIHVEYSLVLMLIK